MGLDDWAVVHGFKQGLKPRTLELLLVLLAKREIENEKCLIPKWEWMWGPHLPRKVEVSCRQTESEKREREEGGSAIL